MSEKPRIIGTEMEWPMTVRYENCEKSQQLTDTTSLKFRLPEGLVSVGSGSFMLSNGGRYYSDVGDRVEYATPETTSFDDLVVRELAGERIVMHGLLEYARQSEKVDSVVLSKRVTDSFQTGWGYHVNLSADRDRIPAINDEHVHLLALHLATSSPMLGGGAVYHDESQNLRYSYSQKALSLTGDYINGTTGTSKPLINQRDESLARGTGLRRIHLTSLDPHISPWAAKMTVGTSSLVLGAIEQGRAKDLSLASRTGNFVLTALNRQVATDIEMKTTIETVQHGMMKAIDIQERLISIVEKTEHTDEEALILKEWHRAVDTLQANPQRMIESDAISKLALIRAWMERNGIKDFNHNRVLGIDDQVTRLLTYHRSADTDSDQTAQEIHNQSRAAKLRAGHFKNHMPADEIILAAITEPPTTTRAYGRGKAIATGRVASADWSQYKYTDQKNNIEIHNAYALD